MSLFALVHGVIYAFAGLAAFVTFLVLEFYAAAAFAFATACISAILGHIVQLRRKQRLTIWYEAAELTQMFWLGFITFAVGTSGFGYFLTILLFAQYEMYLAIAAVWCFITLQNSLALMYYSNKYWKELTGPVLLVNQE